MRNSHGGLLFFNPPYRQLGKEPKDFDSISQIATIPLGPASLFEYLKVRSGLPCDFYHKPDHSIDTIRKLIGKHRPLLVALSCNSYNRFACLMIAHITKDIDPSIRVVLGGVHPTFLDEQMLLKYSFIDYVIRGEGESTLLALVEAIRKGGEVSNIAGLSFRDGEKFMRNRARARIVSLDDVPLIDYKYFESQGMKSNYFRAYGARAIPVETSRGCPFSCDFCTTVGMFSRKVAYRSVEKVIEQIKRIPQPEGQLIYFHDMNFTLNKKYVSEICRALIKNNVNIPWSCSTRVDLVDEDICLMMKDAGCVKVFFGVESLSRTILKGVHKGYTPQDAIESIRTVAATGILARLSFIIGLPGETEETLKESLLNCMKLPPGVQAHVNPLMIIPGSETYALAVKEGFDEAYWLKDHKEAIPLYEGALPMHVLEKWTRVFNSRPISDYHVDAKEGMDDLVRAYRKR